MDETLQVAIKVLDSSDKPLDTNKILQAMPRGLRVEPEQLLALLEEAVGSGKVWRFKPFRSRRPRFWTRPPAELGRRKVLQAVAKGPVKEQEVKRQLQLAKIGMSAAEANKLIDEMVREGVLYRHPPYARVRSRRLAAQPADPRNYLKKAFDELRSTIDKLARCGVEPLRVYETLGDMLVDAGRIKRVDRKTPQPEPSDAQQPQATVPCAGVKRSDERPQAETADALALDALLAAMRRIEPDVDAGAAVPIPELRRILEAQCPDRHTFDNAILQWWRSGKLVLHKHDYPASLSEQERKELVRDELGNYYVGVAVRR